MQTELVELRRELADQASLTSLTDGRLVEASEQLEMAMLDKEVAEERAEASEAEAEGLRERLAIVEVELKVVKDAATSGGEEGGDAARSSLAYVQLEKHNERLKEALIRHVFPVLLENECADPLHRLRDISHETENDQRRKITELERDLAGLDDIQGMSRFLYPLKPSVQGADCIHSAIRGISIPTLQCGSPDRGPQKPIGRRPWCRGDVGPAHGAQFDARRGLSRTRILPAPCSWLISLQKIEEMRIIIEDLEALKELSDELEENHVETERALQDDIGLLLILPKRNTFTDILVVQNRRKPRFARTWARSRRSKTICKITRTQSDSSETWSSSFNRAPPISSSPIRVADYPFSDLDALRTQSQTAQTESATHATQSAAMMSLNLKLQSSALKNQAKTIDLELRRIEAKEGRELLSIVHVRVTVTAHRRISDSICVIAIFAAGVHRLGF